MQRPNILLIYTDQQRWDTLAANGNGDIHTPNLDRLAAEGTSFDHCFVQHPLCMPSRVSMLSGQYPSALRIPHMGVPVPTDTVTLPRLLRPYGYTSANIGKLHFLPHANRDHRVPYPDYGFQHYEIADEPGVYEDAYRAWVRHHAPEQLDRISPGLPPATAVWYETMGWTDPVQHPHNTGPRSDFKGAIPFAADDGLTHSAFVGEQMAAFLRRQGDQPFLAIAGFYSPHAPWVVPQKYLDLYDPARLSLPTYPAAIDAQRPDDPAEMFSDAQLRDTRHGYYAMISEVDDYVGRLLDTLDATGLRENTVVVFTSDHGEWLGEHLRYGKGYPGDDACSRVPLLVRMPQGRAGQVISDLVEAVDIVPTLLELAGIQAPPHLQGRSLVPALTGAPYTPRDSALTEADGWKTLRTPRYRYLVHADGREQLWDMQADPGAYHDIAAEQPAALAECRRLLLLHSLQAERPLPRTWPY